MFPGRSPFEFAMSTDMMCAHDPRFGWKDGALTESPKGQRILLHFSLRTA